MIFRTLALVAVSTTLAVAPVRADVIEHGPSGLQLDLPGNWTQSADGDLLTVTSPNEDAVLIVLASGHATAEAFMDGLAEELDGFIQNAEITTDTTEEEVNGLMQYYVEGSGEYGGDDVDWDLTFVIGENGSLVVVAIGDIEGHRQTFDEIYSSIAP